MEAGLHIVHRVEDFGSLLARRLKTVRHNVVAGHTVEAAGRTVAAGHIAVEVAHTVVAGVVEGLLLSPSVLISSELCLDE